MVSMSFQTTFIKMKEKYLNLLKLKYKPIKNGFYNKIPQNRFTQYLIRTETTKSQNFHCPVSIEVNSRVSSVKRTPPHVFFQDT